MIIRFFKPILFVFAAYLLAGCSATVGVAGQWTNEALVPEDGYEKVMVTALLANHEARRVIEDEVIDELVQKDIGVSQGLTFFPDLFTPDFDRDREAFFTTINQEGNRAVLVLTVLDSDVMDEYIRTDASYPPMDDYGWYGNFWDYYDYHFAGMGDEGFYTITKRYYIEANVYDVETEELVWSGQTESYDPVDLTSFAGLMAESIVGQLLKSDVVGAAE